MQTIFRKSKLLSYLTILGIGVFALTSFAPNAAAGEHDEGFSLTPNCGRSEPLFHGNGNPVIELDENGDQVLDGNGNPVQAIGTKHCQLDDFGVLIKKIFDFLIKTLAPILAILLIVLGGAIMMISRGSPEQVKKAKDIILYAIIGYIIILFSVFIVDQVYDRFFGIKDQYNPIKEKDGKQIIDTNIGNLNSDEILNLNSDEE